MSILAPWRTIARLRAELEAEQAIGLSLATRLARISGMDTPKASHTVKKMAAISRGEV